jgi:hypothetical protein
LRPAHFSCEQSLGRKLPGLVRSSAAQSAELVSIQLSSPGLRASATACSAAARPMDMHVRAPAVRRRMARHGGHFVPPQPKEATKIARKSRPKIDFVSRRDLASPASSALRKLRIRCGAVSGNRYPRYVGDQRSGSAGIIHRRWLHPSGKRPGRPRPAIFDEFLTCPYPSGDAERRSPSYGWM